MTSASPAKGAQGEKFLKKAERQQCWNARDEFWQCMKSNNEDNSQCTNFRQLFEQHCPPTWVTHFDRKFQYDKFKAEVAKMGYQKLDEDFTKKKE